MYINGSKKKRKKRTCKERIKLVIHMLFDTLEKNMYLPFGKLCNKLLDVKCIIFNSSLILKMSLVKLINTYSIILKLYKS